MITIEFHIIIDAAFQGCPQGRIPLYVVYTVMLKETKYIFPLMFCKLVNSYTFFSFKSHNQETSMSSAVIIFVHTIHKRLQKVPHAKSWAFRFAQTDSHDSTTIL